MIFQINFLKNFVSNNLFLIKLQFKKNNRIEYDHDFSNLCFYDPIKSKKFIIKNKIFFKKNEDDFFTYNSFNWIREAKKLGGADLVKITRNKIIKWITFNHSFSIYISNQDLMAQRLINLIYNFDFYGSTSNKKDQESIKFIIFCHYIFLKKYLSFKSRDNQNTIEIEKAVLLYETIHALNCHTVLEQIKVSIARDVNADGLHLSMSPQIQAEYINHLIEIKNIILFFKTEKIEELTYKVIKMISVLKNYIHKDGSLAYFNGSNNYFKLKIIKICNHEEDIKIKNITQISNGLSVFENKDLKIIFDVVKPYNKLINYGLHASTLSFELSYNKEKIISNCGSLVKKNTKNIDYLRYSAAHSTIIINNTNISEIIENKSYKRIPKKINFSVEDGKKDLILKASHDGYFPNFKKIVKRKICIDKTNNFISGRDEIICVGIRNKKNLYSIRFHLTPICKILLARNKMSVIIKTNLSSFIFKSDNIISIEESIFVNDLNKIVKTSQIVISGFNSDENKIIKWSFSKF